MHLGNGAVTPACAAITFATAGAGLGAATVALRHMGIDRNRLLTAGALSGAIFAAQMVNVPVLPFSSAHLVGGVLAAWVLGPALGALCMAVVLASQALLLGDGGLMALGANIINIGLLPAAVVWAVRGRSTRLTAGVTASLAVIAAALFIAGEVALFRSADQLRGFATFASQMLGIHLWIAVPEGLLTVAILMALGGVAAPGELRLDQTRLGGCWGAAALLVLCLLPLSSPMPDGYEASAERSGMTRLMAEDPADLAIVGQLNVRVAGWQETIVTSLQEIMASGQLRALVSTIFAGLTAYGVASMLTRRRMTPA